MAAIHSVFKPLQSSKPKTQARLTPVLLTIALPLLLSGCKTLLSQSSTTAPTASNTAATQVSGSRLNPQDKADMLAYIMRPQAGEQTEQGNFAEIDRYGRPPFPFETEQFIDTAETEAAHDYTMVPAPVGTSAHTETAPAPVANLWVITRDNLQLDHQMEHPRIQSQLNWYVRHPKYLNRVSERASRYYYHILNEVLERGMPAEIAMLPIVESAYDPFAYSHGRAAGPWQFIPGTARHFGLKKTWWYDGRRDILASTDAALTYLEQLHNRFDDWYLALAAYNAGGGTVSKAMRKNRQKNLPTDFFSLNLPRETRAYVPKLIALAKIIDDPAKYNLTLPVIPDEPYFAKVDIGSQMDLAQAAELTGISLNELYLLNPAFNQWATDPDGPYHLLVPHERADDLRTALAELPEKQRLSWKRYTIAQGDSLIGIAKEQNTTVETLRSVNNIRGNLIRAGQTLMIPTASLKPERYALSSDQRQLKKNERMASRNGNAKLIHQVKSGESFWTISRHYKVGVRELAKWNNMAPGDPLGIGKKLVVWKTGNSANKVASTRSGKLQPVNMASTATDRSVIRKVGYKVREGDSLWRIASRFNVSVNDIKRWNSLSNKKYLQPGDNITLFVNVTSAY